MVFLFFAVVLNWGREKLHLKKPNDAVFLKSGKWVF